MIATFETGSPKVVGVKLSGRLHDEDYRRFVPMIESILTAEGSVTVVLIGAHTASRRWVKYEIEQSIARGKGLLGIRIHDLKDSDGKPSLPGPDPTVPSNVTFPIYTWDGDGDRLRREIEAAAKRATPHPKT